MSKIDQYFERYGEHHQNPVNKAIHWVCVPLIMFSLLGLIWMIPFPFKITYLNWASFVIAGVVYYYWTLSKPLAIVMLLVVALMAMGIVGIEMNSSRPALIFFGVFILSWIGQFIGHKIEGKKPSFLEDLRFLLIGPLWLLHFIFKKIGVSYE